MSIQKRLFFISIFLVSLLASSSALEQRSLQLPLTFEPNRGQADAQALFVARTAGNSIALTQDGAVLSTTTGSGSPHKVHIHLNGMAAVQPLGESPTGGFANYYHSQDRGQWLTHIPLYSRVRYTSVNQGVDLLFHGHDGQMEYDFEIAAGTSPRNIKFRLEGADHLSIAPNGDLEFHAGPAHWTLLKPAAYQVTGDQRRPVQSSYQILADGSIGFAVGSYDHTLPLTIDPVVQYSNIIGVNNDITVSGIQVDASGNLYIAGDTFATNYPVVNGQGPAPSGSDEIVITKLDPSGSTILFSTYIPASGFSTANSLAVDASGNAYVSGIAGSSDFPLTSTNLGSCSQFCNAGFVAKFAADGTLVYSTLLSSGQSLPKGLAVDNAGSAYVAGLAADNTLQTVNAFQSGLTGGICTSCTNAFFAKLNPAGDGYIFASYFANPLHTSGESFATGVAIDASNNLYIAGQGDSPILNPWQIGGSMFVAKFAPDGRTLLFSSGFGGNGGNITGIRAGSDGTLFLAGKASNDFPFGLNNRDIVQDNGNSMFAAAIDPTLTRLTYSTYLGDGNLNSIYLNPTNNHFYLAGAAVQNLPPLANAAVSDLGSLAGFAMELNALGTPVTVTQFGGHSATEIPTAIAADATSNVYVAGALSPQNSSPADPILVGPSPGQLNPFSFASFFAKISPANAPQISLATFPPFLVLRNAGSVDLHISNIALSGGLVNHFGNCGATVPAGSSCVLTVTDVNNHLSGGTVAITSDAQPSVQSFDVALPLGAHAGTPIGDFLYFSDTPTFFPPEVTGGTTAPRTLTLSNVGTAAATINSIVPSGGLAQSNNCPATLSPGASCAVQLTVTAGAGQPFLHITYDNGATRDYQPFVPVSSTQLLLSATGISFNTQLVQGIAIPRTITVTNTGNASVSVLAPSLTGDPTFILTGNTCALLAPHQSCAAAVQYNPVVSGLSSAILNIAGQQVQLSGQGEFNSSVQISPLQLNFFPEIVHQTATLSLTLNNTSAGPITIAAFSFSRPDYSETDDCQGQVPANGSCTVQVGFTPQALGARDATMTINFVGTTPQTLALAGGVGVTPMDVTPASLTFGSTLISTTSPSQFVSLGNGRQGVAQPYTLAVSADFTITQNVCPNPMPVFTGCGIQVAFAPTTPGAKQGALTVSYPGITEQSVVTLNGNAVSAGAVVSLPATFDLGSTPVGTGVQKPVTVSNTGNTALTITGFSLSGASPADFSVAPGQCATVAAGASCTIQVGFNPGAPLQRQATLTISDNGLNAPHSVALTGVGVGPSISFFTSPVSIGQVLLGNTTNTQVLIGNAGNADLLISSVGVSGGNSADFKVDIGLCATLHSSSTCALNISFTPSAAGTRNTLLVINDNQVGSPQALPVSGTGVGSAYSAPATFDFGNVVLGLTNPRSITITNSGNLTLSLNSVSVTGDFTASHNCFSIAPSASCQIAISFTPTATGARVGTLTISDNTFVATRLISLTGNGTDFQLAGPGNTPVSTTVKAGQPATYNLNFSSSGGFTGPVTLACTGAPQAATCSISPSTLQISASGSVPFTVTVDTQTVVAATTGPQVFFAGMSLMSLLALAPLMFLRRFRTSIRARSVALSILLVAFCLMAPGCGGGGGTQTPVPTPPPVVQTTPAGTYTLTLTATAAGASRQIPLTLVVQ